LSVLPTSNFSFVKMQQIWGNVKGQYEWIVRWKY